MKIKKIAQTPGLVATVVDNLNSESTTDALSAKQGKILNEKIDEQNKIEQLSANEFFSSQNIQCTECYIYKIRKTY